MRLAGMVGNQKHRHLRASFIGKWITEFFVGRNYFLQTEA